MPLTAPIQQHRNVLGDGPVVVAALSGQGGGDLKGDPLLPLARAIRKSLVEVADRRAASESRPERSGTSPPEMPQANVLRPRREKLDMG